MDTQTLTYLAIRWLQFEKRCALVLYERGPSYIYRPDVMGVMPSRHWIEIEIKQTLSDFKANGTKRIIEWRKNKYANPADIPQQFYFLVPEKLVDKVQAMLPENCGLMTCRTGQYQITVVKRCEKNPKAGKLGKARCLRIAHLQGNAIASALSAAISCRCQYGWKHSEPEYSI